MRPRWVTQGFFLLGLEKLQRWRLPPSLGREASSPAVRKQTPRARHQCSLIRACCPSSPWKEHFILLQAGFETNPGWFWLTSLRSSSRLRKQQQAPTWKHKHLLTLVQGAQKGCWVYHKDGCVHLRSCSSHTKLCGKLHT